MTEEIKHDVTLGNEYTDTVTGFKGVATAVAYYLTGCEQVALTAHINGDIKEWWFDVTRVQEVKKKAAPKRKATSVDKVGGPQSTPPSQHS